MVLVSAIEPLDQLLKGPKLFGDLVEVLQTEDLAQGMRGLIFSSMGIEKVQGRLGVVLLQGVRSRGYDVSFEFQC